jgi:hypothetical protein
MKQFHFIACLTSCTFIIRLHLFEYQHNLKQFVAAD